MLQSQNHGFIYENEIRQKVFHLQMETNNTNIHDIPHDQNMLNKNENISIKTTGSNTICCGDILRFYNYDFTKTNTLIVVKYNQIKETKSIENIYEIDYNKECHALLFGNCPYSKIEEYVKFVKSIPYGNVNTDIMTKYKNDKKNLQQQYNCSIKINPKIDSKTQRRVQCSITNFETTLHKYITYKSQLERPNVIRNIILTPSIYSVRRSFHKSK